MCNFVSFSRVNLHHALVYVLTIARPVRRPQASITPIRHIPRRIRPNTVRGRLVVVDACHDHDPVLVVGRQPRLYELVEVPRVVVGELRAKGAAVVPPVVVRKHRGDEDGGDGLEVCGHGLSDVDLVVHFVLLLCFFFWFLYACLGGERKGGGEGRK